MFCLVGKGEWTDGMPKLYMDAGWKTLNHTVLSTSNCGLPCLRAFGFGPTSPDGYGIGYIIKEDGLSICASSKHLQTARFMGTLERYLIKIEATIMESHRAANVRLADTYVDHQGREIDVRSGRPLSSRKLGANGYTDDWETDSGVAGYSFYEDANQKKENVPRQDTSRSRIANVGRRLLNDSTS